MRELLGFPFSAEKQEPGQRDVCKCLWMRCRLHGSCAAPHIQVRSRTSRAEVHLGDGQISGKFAERGWRMARTGRRAPCSTALLGMAFPRCGVDVRSDARPSCGHPSRDPTSTGRVRHHVGAIRANPYATTERVQNRWQVDAAQQAAITLKGVVAVEE